MLEGLQPYLRRLLWRRSHWTKKAGRVLEITFEDLWAIWVAQDGKCALSGVSMTWITGRGRSGVHTNASIDQVDPGKGYVAGNVQLVCMIANKMKSDLAERELVEWAKKVVEYAGSKSERGSQEQDGVVRGGSSVSWCGSDTNGRAKRVRDTPDLRPHPDAYRRRSRSASVRYLRAA